MQRKKLLTEADQIFLTEAHKKYLTVPYKKHLTEACKKHLDISKRNWQQLLGWISRCRLDAMIKVGQMVRRYLWGILNAIRLKVNNSMVEAKNASIQRIKKIACGYRNRKRFKNAILFHLGGLDLQPFPTR